MTTTPPERPAPDATAAPSSANTDPTDATPTREDTPVSGEPEPRAPEDPLRGSRTSGAWIGLAVVAILLVLLIIFIAQNTQKVQVAFLGWEGKTPLSVAILASVVTGLVVAAIAGSLRILQLRRRVKRSAR
jgi:uncharacterized integral membrane protein